MAVYDRLVTDETKQISDFTGATGATKLVTNRYVDLHPDFNLQEQRLRTPPL